MILHESNGLSSTKSIGHPNIPKDKPECDGRSIAELCRQAVRLLDHSLDLPPNRLEQDTDV